MSMSTSVIGFIPPDDKFKKMLKAYRACEEAGIAIPADVEKFFDGEPPDNAGVQVHLSYGTKGKDAVKEYRDNDANAEGYEIDLRKLDPNIKVLRFTNSW